MDELFQDKTPEQRIKMLEANAVRVETENIKRFFTEEELSEMKNNLSDLSIEKNDKEEELKAISKDLREKIKGFSAEIKSTLKNLKNKSYVSTETVYLMDDQEKGIMFTYDQNGLLIGQRKLRPEEKQTRIVDFTKTA